MPEGNAWGFFEILGTSEDAELSGTGDALPGCFEGGNVVKRADFASLDAFIDACVTYMNSLVGSSFREGNTVYYYFDPSLLGLTCETVDPGEFCTKGVVVFGDVRLAACCE